MSGTGTLGLAPIILLVLVVAMWAADRILRALELRSLRVVPVATARQSHPSSMGPRRSTTTVTNQPHLPVGMPTVTCAPPLATGATEDAPIRRHARSRDRDAA